MGRRNRRHVFFPGRFVFPGGRVDPTDWRVSAAPYAAATARRLEAETPRRCGSARAKAFGIAALRETYEETGVVIGRAGAPIPQGPGWSAFTRHNVGLDLSLLTFVCRAVTPPGRPRRYDTRFFLALRTTVAAIDTTLIGPEAELEAIDWVPVDTARTMDLPRITLTVLNDLLDRLAHPDDDCPVPFYRYRGKAFVKTLL